MKNLGQYDFMTGVAVEGSQQILRVGAFQSGPDLYLELSLGPQWGEVTPTGFVRVVGGYQEVQETKYRALQERLKPLEDVAAREQHMQSLQWEIQKLEGQLEALKTASNLAGSDARATT